MGDALNTCPVTSDLLQELIRSEKMITEYRNPKERLNDAAHYGPAALQLEALVKAVLAAQSSGSLLAPQPVAARFPVDVNSLMPQTMDSLFLYLSGRAQNLLSNDRVDLSKFQKIHVTYVIDRLAELTGKILSGIYYMANRDLIHVRDTGTELLVAMADVVAKVALGDSDGIQALADLDRCDVTFTDGRRCTKAAGHRPPGSQDTHTPN